MRNVNSQMTRWISLALLAATVGLLALVPAAEAEVRVSPNFKVNNDSSPFRGRDQAGLATNPANPQHVVAIYSNYLDSTCEASASFDGGSTWTAPYPLVPPTAGAGEQPFFKSCTNTVGLSQYVEFGSGNNVYTAATAQRLATGFLQDPTGLFYRSTDGGRTWQPGVVAMAGGPGSADFTSGPSYYRPAIGVHRGGGTGGADRIYLAARVIQGNGKQCGQTCQPIRSVVSNNNGQTWSAPVDVTPTATNVTDFASQPVINKDGSVTVAWRNGGNPGGLIQVARSADGGQTWSNPIDVTQVTNAGTAVTSHVTAPGTTSNSGSYPRMVSDPNAGANGRIYMVYQQGPAPPTAPAGGYTGADHWQANAIQVWFQRSNDGGLTWSTPKRITEQLSSLPGVRIHQTRHPMISLSPGGRINVTWHDRRHWYQGPGERLCAHSHIFCEDSRLGDTYYSWSNDGGGSFSKPIRINDRSLNLEVGYDTRPSGYWWFGPVSATVGNGRQLIAWMDSREGNWDTDNEDIYLARVDLDAAGRAPKTHIDPAANNVARSVALSKFGYPAGAEGALVGGLRDPANPPGCTAALCPTGPASRNASSVVIVNEGDEAGALAGAVLARANPGPVLLSSASGLSAAVKAEVTRMRPGAAFIIGDTGKLSGQVQTDLAAAGVPAGQITRLSGASDAATAAAVANRLDYRTQAEKDANTPAFDAVVIANPASPDAAAAAGLAAARRLPFLFVDANSVPAATATALTDLDIDKTLVIGGTSVVGPGLSLPNPTRLGGANVYETSEAVVTESEDRGMPGNVVYVADGAKPMDGALLGNVVARASGILLLTRAPLWERAVDAAYRNVSGIDRIFVLGAAPSVTTPPKKTYPVPPPNPDTGAFAGCPSGTTNVIRGTAGRDTLRGTARGDRIFALGGNDVVDALAGNDCVDLGAGNDRAQGRAGNDLILGAAGSDRASGSGGKDKLGGGGGSDRLDGGSGNDSLTGGSGKDRLKGGRGRDRLSGGSGADRISARDKTRDRVTCGSGRDVAIVDRVDRVSGCERVLRR